MRAAALLVECGACTVLLASRSGRVLWDGQGVAARLESTAAAGVLVAADGADAHEASGQVVRDGQGLAARLESAGAAGVLVPVTPTLPLVYQPNDVRE